MRLPAPVTTAASTDYANGWKGFGPVPFSHVPNQGVLRAIAALANASKMIGDTSEYDRCWQMLTDADPDCAKELL